MQKDSMSILVCPVCRGKLKLDITEENGENVISGFLYCPHCDTNYPIVDTIPNLLPPKEIAR